MEQPALQGPWAFLVPAIAITLIMLRGSRGRRLYVGRMWIIPSMIMVVVGLTLWVQPVPSLPGMIGQAFALGMGVALGWWRGRVTTITVDPQTHALTSKASPIGLVLIAGMFLVRYLLRDHATAMSARMGLTALEIADIFLFLAVGLVCAQRLEMWIRARKLLESARLP